MLYLKLKFPNSIYFKVQFFALFDGLKFELMGYLEAQIMCVRINPYSTFRNIWCQFGVSRY